MKILNLNANLNEILNICCSETITQYAIQAIISLKYFTPMNFKKNSINILQKHFVSQSHKIPMKNGLLLFQT